MALGTTATLLGAPLVLLAHLSAALQHGRARQPDPVYNYPAIPGQRARGPPEPMQEVPRYGAQVEGKKDTVDNDSREPCISGIWNNFTECPSTTPMLTDIYHDDDAKLIMPIAQTRAEDILNALTDAEICALSRGFHFDGAVPDRGYYHFNLPGVERLKIPKLKGNLGSTGFVPLLPGEEFTSTSFPSPLALAATFDVEMARRVGRAIGSEFTEKGANAMIGPDLHVVRALKDGLSWESLCGEDPFLGAWLAKSFIHAVQQTGVMAIAKYFPVEAQETNRMDVDLLVDERTLYEMYYPPFDSAIEAGLAGVMCATNSYNFKHSCANPELLQVDLKEKMRFPGIVVSDECDKSSETAVEDGTGLDIVMGCADAWKGTLAGDYKASANDESPQKSGSLELLGERKQDPQGNSTGNSTGNASFEDAKAVSAKPAAQDNISIVREPTGPATTPQPTEKTTTTGTTVPHTTSLCKMTPARKDAAKRVLTTMFKFETDLRPECAPPCITERAENVRDTLHTATAREAARESVVLLRNNNSLLPLIRPIGAGKLVCLGANSAMNTHKYYAAIGSSHVPIPKDAEKPCDAVVRLANERGWSTGTIDDQDIDTTVRLAQGADVVVAFAGATAMETRDRDTAVLDDNADKLLWDLAFVIPNLVVALMVPGAVLMKFDARLQGALAVQFYGGEEAGTAMAEALFNVGPPSGRLPVSMPYGTGDMVDPESTLEGTLGEGLHVGYRDARKHFRYKFGCGLSYTNFTYGRLEVVHKFKKFVRGQEWCPDDNLCLRFAITNTGDFRGKDVAQAYCDFRSAVPWEPPKKLCGIRKTRMLQPGETQYATMFLTAKEMGYWSEAQAMWVPAATMNLEIGSSIHDIKLRASNMQWHENGHVFSEEDS